MDRARFLSFSEADRLGHVAAEVSRFRIFTERQQDKLAEGARQRALELARIARESADPAAEKLLKELEDVMAAPVSAVKDLEKIEQALLARKLSEIS